MHGSPAAVIGLATIAPTMTGSGSTGVVGTVTDGMGEAVCM